MSDYQPISPDKNALKKIIKKGKSLTIFSPFYTRAGLLLLKHLLDENNSIKEINFNCRLTTHDWIQGSIDPISLHSITKSLSGKIKFHFACNDILHAKVYYCEKKGLIGSANLTSRGFGTGLEFLLFISGDILERTQEWVNSNISPHLTPISLKGLSRFINKNKTDVEKQKEKIRKLIKKKRKPKKIPLPISPIDGFIDYCANLRGEAPKEVVLRFMGKLNLSGHIKNFYYASQQFLSAHQTIINPISRMSPEKFRLRNTPYKDKWINFVNSENLKDDPKVGYSAESTLKYLPAGLGGTQTTGGGGIGNINRVLPLVARFRKTDS